MGVHGLWRLIEPSGRPVPLETLENKVLAVDVSIWLHQIIKGYQDNRGAAVPNAHLLGIYHRVCKLLYFRIKPVFVFDGGVPVLKRNTIALRNQQKLRTLSAADRIHKNLLAALIKHSAISKVLSEKAKAAITASTSPSKKSKTEDDELYVLPPSQLDSTVSSSDEESDEDAQRHFDLHSIDTESAEFKSLPVDVRHEILTDLKETRKQSSWGRIHELPTESNDFSGYQMMRLLKRQSVQVALEEVEKEMGGHTLSLGELEKLLKDQGVIGNLKGNRIASDENTRFLLIKDIKQAVEEAKKQSLDTIEEKEERVEEEETGGEKVKNKGDKEFEDDLQRAIALSLEEAPSTSKQGEEQPSTSSPVKKIGRKGKNRMPLSFLADFEDADFGDSESSEEEIQIKLTPAQRYMMEYSGLTSHEISRIIASKSGITKKGVAKSVVKAAESTGEEQNEEHVEPVEEESVVTTSTKQAEENANEDVEVMSDSESSCDEFVEVEEKKNQNEAMEVVIQPDEEIGDDLFKDVFEKNEKGKEKGFVEGQNEKNGAEAMGTVIKPVEEIEEDLFRDVFEDKHKEVKDKKNEAIEVVIKPNEEIEDDLFKDVFESEEKHKQTEVSSTQDSVIESIKQFVSNTTNEELVSSTVTKEKEVEEKSEERVAESTSQNLKNKINSLVQNYTKPKDKGESSELSVEQLNEMRENLRKEQKELVKERSTKERLAGNITDQMCQEAQELLELFGVPYLVAPMEAEAQCAFLDLVGLTDGTITDDSDIWLFGGRTVYKNFFDQNKIVMEFKSENIQQNYKLSREQMILLAMLVGSDYTIGLKGVGPVTALEILAAFPPKDQLVSGLAEFKSWFTKGKRPGPGKTALKGKLKNLSFTDSFPNPQIIQAYLEPTVETSREKFSWAKPDVIGLEDFAKQKFGWSKVKSEEILNPILKRLEDNRVQRSITDYFKSERKVKSNESADIMMSKRVKSALNRIAKGPDHEEESEKKKRVSKKKDQEPKVRKRKHEKNDEDEEIKILKETEERSKQRVEEIEKEVQEKVEEENMKKTVNLHRLHKKEVIPQKQKDKSEMLKNKLKAIETFRRSKQGPGYVKKRTKTRQETKKDSSYLSESSDSN